MLTRSQTASGSSVAHTVTTHISGHWKGPDQQHYEADVTIYIVSVTDRKRLPYNYSCRDVEWQEWHGLVLALLHRICNQMNVSSIGMWKGRLGTDTAEWPRGLCILSYS